MNLRSCLDKMIAAHASDLHLKVGTPPILRVDGQLFLPPAVAKLS